MFFQGAQPHGLKQFVVRQWLLRQALSLNDGLSDVDYGILQNWKLG